MSYLGDFATASTVVVRFNTEDATGAPVTLGGTPAVSVYKNSTTQSTAGVTLTVDYDSTTGLQHVAIDTSADGTFYAAGNTFDVVITTGTVNGISAVGSVVGSFSLAQRVAVGVTLHADYDAAKTAASASSVAAVAASVAAVAAFIDTEIATIITTLTGATVEPTAIAAQTASLAAKIDGLYQLAINKHEETTAGAHTLYKSDDVTVVGTGANSDDGTTFTKGKVS